MSSDDGTDRTPARRPAATVDATDRRILDLLRADARMSMRDVAAQVGVSRANAYARVDRLRRDGVITGFTVAVDPQRLGVGISAYVSVKIQQQSWKAVRGRLARLPQVEHVALVSGDYDLVLLVRVTDAVELRDVVLEELQAIPEVTGTQTVFILDEVRPGPS